jgi:uncharacterized protein with PIN domain
MTTSYHFHGDLLNLLRLRWRATNPVVQPVSRSASIKDVVESFGLPHTEIDRLECNGQLVDFSQRVEQGQQFDIYPVLAPWDITQPNLLRPYALTDIRFIVDGNVGSLARYLRMAGFDTLYDPLWDEQDLLHNLLHEQRILLTRNLDLLKRKQVVFGRYIRANATAAQFREVLNLFALKGQAQPLIRCLNCNALLQPVDKRNILHRLEPLTIRYFDTFAFCPHCDKIYWAGSHVDRMKAHLSDAKIIIV